METKEEISDTDSGIILHSGPDSPCTVMKDLTTHTRAVRVKLESLEERLEACVLELKKLCIREAELTGQLSPDYPLLPGEKPPQVRRRIGAAFKLDDQSLLKTEASALSAVEAELALQQQIVVAARRLCQEGALSKAVKRSRQQQCRLEENKLKKLQEAVFQLRLQHGRTSPHPAIAGKRDHGVSDDSSLSDSAVLDDEERTNPASQSSLEPPPPEAKTVSGPTPHLQDHDLRHTPSPTHQTHTYTHTHTPPQTLILRVPSAQHTHHPLSPSPGHTHNHLASPTRSPSLRHTQIMTNALPSPSLSHTHIMTSPLASPSLSHTIIMTSPLASPSLSHTHVSLSPSPSPSPSVSSSLGGGGAVVAGDDERPPIEHSPWSESSLDKPYEKNKKHRSSSRRSTSPAVTPTLPPLEVCVGEAGRPLPLPLPLGLKPTQTCSAPCTPEMQLRRGLSLRLLSSDDGYSVDQERGRLSRRRVTDLGMSPECSPLYAGVGNPLYHSSSEDSASEHSSASYTSSRHREDPCQSAAVTDTPEYGHHSPYARPSNDPYARPSNDPYARPSNDPYARPSNDPYARPSNDPYGRPSNDPYGRPSNDPYARPLNDPYARPSNDPYGRPSDDPYGRPSDDPSSPVCNGFYRNPQHQSTPSFPRVAFPTGRTRAHLPEAELGLGPASGRYDYRLEEAVLAVPAHVRLSRAPSLRENPRLHPAYGLPREVVSDQLKSWHQRQQFHRPRPRSLDRHRQGAVRIRNTASRESPLSQQPLRLDQPPQAGQGQRMAERNCGPWTTEDDGHIISQV